MAAAYLASSHNTSAASLLVASYSRTAALVRSLTNLLNEFHSTHVRGSTSSFVQGCGERVGRYSSGAQKISLHSCVTVTSSPAACLTLAYVGRIRPPLELLVGAKTDSWLVGANKNER